MLVDLFNFWGGFVAVVIIVVVLCECVFFFSISFDSILLNLR